eukprot:TRINITY_DN2208_c0_g1_i1.p1 TRINITY_DN2208_c0_g1~~TRINITY_DN2208_c0_g1_i1.p1  ORF type:complete len:295 (-),score=93.29 TRINITY_DN2208_c0_g1_i1:111-938(-)
MDLGIKDKVAVVTGSTGGIGKGIARELARYGARVVINGRSDASVAAAIADLAKELSLSADRFIPVATDVSTKEGCETFIRLLDEKLTTTKSEVEILVCNVGFYHVQDFFEVDDEKWDEYFQLNVMSNVRLARKYLKPMLQKNDNGRVIIIASEAGIRGLPHMLPYSVSKTAQIGLARGLAELTKGTTVTVNSVLVGPTWTEGVEKYIASFAEANKIETAEKAAKAYFSEHEQTSLIQRFIKTKEVADIICFLASPLSAAINGSAQNAEGGIIRHI